MYVGPMCLRTFECILSSAIRLTVMWSRPLSPIKPKFHYADFHRNFNAGKVAYAYHESCGHKPSRHVCDKVHDKVRGLCCGQKLRKSATQIMKVSDMICVADFHDLCLQLCLRGSFGESRKVGVMEFGLYESSSTRQNVCKISYLGYNI